jgi:class III poly(R)-hydroxyalkanoic acid synthase PhaE subunit
MKGDWGAQNEARSLWREVYDDTLGRVMRTPGFGLTKEQTERYRKTYDAYIQYASALPNFYEYFYNTGRDSLKEVFDKVKNLKVDEMKPETMREIYKIWWTTNENAFFELFNKPDFGQAMSEVLNYGLRLKKRLDDLSAEWCETMSIPSNKEFDEVAMAIQELRRTVHSQQRTIEELQEKLEKASKRRK